MKGKTLIKRFIRKRRVRAKISGTSEKPRISVFRSSRYVEVQLIDDSIGKTIVRVSTKGMKGSRGKVELAQKAGELLAQKAKEAGIEKAVFDRRHYKYHGRVKAVAEGARAGGLKL
jgi:large subunit ribosomal protein L18